MAKGQKPKPTEIKIREGNRSKVKKADLRPDLPGLGTPAVPVHLTADERSLWAMVVQSLPKGLLSRADDSVLERMAIAWAQYREATRMIHKTGLMIQSPQGPVRNPLLVTQRHAAQAMHSAGEVIGLSPVARARLSADAAGVEDPMTLLLGMDGDEDGAWATAPRTRQ